MRPICDVSKAAVRVIADKGKYGGLMLIDMVVMSAALLHERQVSLELWLEVKRR